jgi:hypothetical protein
MRMVVGKNQECNQFCCPRCCKHTSCFESESCCQEGCHKQEEACQDSFCQEVGEEAHEEGFCKEVYFKRHSWNDDSRQAYEVAQRDVGHSCCRCPLPVRSQQHMLPDCCRCLPTSRRQLLFVVSPSRVRVQFIPHRVMTLY